MTTIAREPGRHLGVRVGTGHCVALVRELAGLPPTAHWRRGMLVRDGDVPAGAAIATFDSDGRYGNHTDGRSHACILEAETTEGLEVVDQWMGQPCQRRTIRFKGGRGKPVDDGDAYHIIELQEST
jgi:hypothetical protein